MKKYRLIFIGNLSWIGSLEIPQEEMPVFTGKESVINWSQQRIAATIPRLHEHYDKAILYDLDGKVAATWSFKMQPSVIRV